MELEKNTVKDLLDQLASSSPAPGGGSAAALCGAIAGALAAMTANLTIGREKFKENEPVMKEVLTEAEALREKFVKLMDEDCESFNMFMNALKMPKETDDDKAARKIAIADASKASTKVPLRTLESCVQAARLAAAAAKAGNPIVASDAGCAAVLAEAAGRCAAYNVRINLPRIRDQEFAFEARGVMKKALESIAKYTAEAVARMNEIL
jgi:glutamate formiminotransferase/formiminotetrahydrofolate cyclodeaminase